MPWNLKKPLDEEFARFDFVNSQSNVYDQRYYTTATTSHMMRSYITVGTSITIHADRTDAHSSAGHLLCSKKSFLANEFDVVSSLAITWRELFWLRDGWPLPSVQSLEVTTAVAGESRGSGWRQESAGTDAWGQDPEKRAGTCWFVQVNHCALGP